MVTGPTSSFLPSLVRPYISCISRVDSRIKWTCHHGIRLSKLDTRPTPGCSFDWEHVLHGAILVLYCIWSSHYTWSSMSSSASFHSRRKPKSQTSLDCHCGLYPYYWDHLCRYWSHLREDGFYHLSKLSRWTEYVYFNSDGVKSSHWRSRIPQWRMLVHSSPSPEMPLVSYSSLLQVWHVTLS